jgi:acetolactate synthase-1/2/3 large subunit
VPTVASLIVRRLLEAGTTHLFGMPGGGSSLDIIEAAGDAGLRFVLSHTETAGALMASAQAELTGAPAACLATMGPGATSIVNGTAHALLDRAAVVVLTDSYPASTRPLFSHQRIDHRAVLGPVTKWSGEITADAADEVVRRAIAVARAAPAGPVHLDCAAEVSACEVDVGAPRDAAPGLDGRAAEAPRPLGQPREITPPLQGLLRGVRKPVLIAGLGARERDDGLAIRRFLERHRVPALVTYKGKGVVPDHHPWFAGIFTNGAIERPLLEQADLVLAVGLDPVELIPRTWPYQQPVIYCGRWKVDDRQVPFGAELVMPIRDALDLVSDCLSLCEGWSEDDVCRERERQKALLRVPVAGLAPHRVVERLADCLARTARLTIDAGAHMFPAIGLWPASAPGDVLISNGLSTMGFALPAAIGSALTDPARPVVALTGDGGLLMCMGELATAQRERLDITVVVLKDDRLSLIDIKQRQRRYREAGVDLGDIRWTSVASGMGLASASAGTEEDLVRCVQNAEGRRGPTLIEARIDPGGYGETLRAVRG